MPASDEVEAASTAALGSQPATDSGGTVVTIRQSGLEPGPGGGPGPGVFDAPSQLDHEQQQPMTRHAGLPRRPATAIPQTLCLLGQLPPVSCPPDRAWAFDLIRDAPATFASQAETVFIHKHLFSATLPRPLRTAWGICSGAVAVTMNEHSQRMLFKVITAEIADTLLAAPDPTSSVPESSLLHDLAALQAVVLYQTIRIYCGDLEQRLAAEQQEYLVKAYALKLLRRAEAELPRTKAGGGGWETWILAESVRRTVIVAFKLYTGYWSFVTGACVGTAALEMLPLSAARPGAWQSRDRYLGYAAGADDRDQTVTCAEFFAHWREAPRADTEVFERFLLVGSMGIHKVNGLSCRASLEG